MTLLTLVPLVTKVSYHTNTSLRNLNSFQAIPTDVISIVNTFGQRKQPVGEIAFQAPLPNQQDFYYASCDDIFIFGRNVGTDVELTIYEWNREQHRFISSPSGPFITMGRGTPKKYCGYDGVAMYNNRIYILTETVFLSINRIFVYDFSGSFQLSFELLKIVHENYFFKMDVYNDTLWFLEHGSTSHLRNFSKQGKLLSHFILPGH